MTKTAMAVKLTDDLVTEWQYRFAERIGMLCEDRRANQHQVDMATDEANEWLTAELTGQEPAPKQHVLLLEDLENGI